MKNRAAGGDCTLESVLSLFDCYMPIVNQSLCINIRSRIQPLLLAHSYSADFKDVIYDSDK